MPELEQIPAIILEKIEASRVSRRNAFIRETTHYILREWIAQTPGALPAFPADNAAAAMAVAKMYVETCEAMVFEPAPLPPPPVP